MLFGPAKALRITYEAVRQAPDHAEGICLGMIAAVEAYDAELALGLDQDPEKTQAIEPPKPAPVVGPRPLKEPATAAAK
jgi:hypothetical protein